MGHNDSTDPALRAPSAEAWAVMPEYAPLIAAAQAGRLVRTDADLEAIRARRSDVATAGPGVAVLPMKGMLRGLSGGGGLLGMLFGSTLGDFRDSFSAAVTNPDIKAILMDIDSPGGSTDHIAEVAATVRDARGSKPIVAVANTIAASAAYWIASQADEVVVTPSGEVGSIGVFAMHDDLSKMDEMMGIKTTLISAGKFKTEGNPFEPLSEEAKTAIQATVDEFYGMFVADVAKTRGVSVAEVRDGFGQGRMVTARSAVKAGMADRVATLDETASRLADSRRRARVGSTAGDTPAHDDGGSPPSTDNPARESNRALLLARERHL